MKAQILKPILTAVIFTCIEIAAVAQASWTVNPNLYDYSMTVTGKIVIDGAVSVDQNDVVAAFIGGECRGVVNVKYQATLKDYFVFLMIYSNNPTGAISFKIFDASENKEFDVNSTLSFSVNGIVGSVSSPHEFSVVTKIYEANILSFTIPDQEGYTSIGNNIISLTQKVTGDLSYIAPVFTLSDGAKAYVNDVLQVSGSSVHDFRYSVQYKIVPLMGAPVYYWVTISKATDTSTKIMLSNTTVDENRDSVLIGELTAESDYLGSSYVFSLENATGADNQYFYVSGNRLFAKSAFNYEIKPQYQVNIQVANNSGISKQSVFNVNVTDRNDPPTGISLSTNTIRESTGENEFVARILVNDEDQSEKHVISLNPGNGLAGFDNSFFSVRGDSLILKKKINLLGKSNLKIRLSVTDKGNATLEKDLTLQVVDVNKAPWFVSKPVSFAIQNQVYIYQIQVDDEEDDQLKVSFDDLPGWLTYKENNGLLSGIPYNEHVGECSFTVVVSDGVKEAVQKVSFTVLNINDPPEINQIPGTQYFYTSKENKIILPENMITDPDKGDKLKFQLSTENNSALPEWMIFDPVTLSISGIPPRGEKGVYNLKLTATDGAGLKEYLIFKLEVSISTAIGDQNRNAEFRVYPNPVQNNLYFDIPEGIEDAEINICNIAGQVVKTCHLSPGLAKAVSMNGTDPGIYFARFRQGEIERIQKIVKQ